MRYKTFRALIVSGAVVLGGAGAVYVATRPTPPRPAQALVAPTPAPTPIPVAAPDPVPPPVEDPTPPAAPEKPRPATATAPPAGSEPLRPMDSEILRLAGTAATGDKIKDAFKGQSYKVNLYHDAGTTGWNRAKVDLDRDEKADEKWTFEGQGAELSVKRQVAPADDEVYSVEYRLRAGAWVKK